MSIIVRSHRTQFYGCEDWRRVCLTSSDLKNKGSNSGPSSGFFFSTWLSHSQILFWFPIILWIILTTIHDWRGGSIDVHLKCSTHVGENWGIKTIKQRRFTDDRLGWFLQSLDVDIDDVISAHCNSATIAQSQAAGITWHNFLSPYSHMIFFLFEVPKKFSNNVCVLLHWFYTLRQFLLAPVVHQQPCTLTRIL